MLNIYDGSGHAKRSYLLSFNDTYSYPFLWVSSRTKPQHWERKYYIRDEDWPGGSFYTDCRIHARHVADALKTPWIKFSVDAGGPVFWQDSLEFNVDTGAELAFWVSIDMPAMIGNSVNFETILDSIEHQGIEQVGSSGIHGSLLYQGTFTNGGTWTTTSYTPTPNTLLLAAVVVRPNSIGGVPVANGLTWHLIDSVGYNFTNFTMYVYYTLGPATPGALSIVSSNDAGAIHVVQFTGVNTSGIDGAGAIAQFSSSRDDVGASSFSITLPSAPASDSVIFAAFNNEYFPAELLTTGPHFTQLGATAHTVPFVGYESMLTEWRESNQSADATAPHSTGKWQGIALELKAA